MECPSCHHVLETAVKCEACGQSYERRALEQFEHAQYLLSWLDGRARLLGPDRHAQLRREALGQLQRLRDALGLVPPREPAEIARELALVQATYDQALRWRRRGAVTSGAGHALCRYLAAQRDKLQAQLAGRVVEMEKPSQLQVYAFARKRLPAWRRDIPLPVGDIMVLDRHLRAEQDALVKEMREELALLRAAQAHLQRWTDAPTTCRRPTGDLCAYLAARSNGLKTQLAGDGAKMPSPSDLRLLDYADASLARWAEDIPLAPAEAAALREHISQQRQTLLAPLARQRALALAALQEAEDWSRAAGIEGFPVNSYLRQQAKELQVQLGGRSLAVEPPTDLQIIDYALQSVPAWESETHLRRVEAELMRDYLESRRRALLQPVTPMAIPVPEAAPVAPSPPPAARPVSVPPSAPPPREPPFTFDPANWWDRAWGLVASGTFLKGLLYLGAFMIVVAVAVLAVRYWNQFPTMVQLACIAAVPMAFYANGFVLRKWFTAPVAGGVFTGIGALLVAVDFIVVYEYGGLAGTVDGRLYWLGASLFCTVSYALTAWRLPSEFFGYVTLAGACSTVLAFTSLPRPSLEWHIAALTAFAVLMVKGSARLHRGPARWQDLAQAAWRLPQTLLPLCQALVVCQILDVYPALLPQVPGGAWLGQMATFLLAAVGYAWLAFDPRSEGKWSAILAQASVWSTVPAAGLALQAAALPPQWYATVVAALAPVYAVANWSLVRRLVAGRSTEKELAAHAFRLGLEWVGYGTMLLGVLGGVGAVALDHVAAGVAAMTLAALDLALFATIYRRPPFVFAACGLFIVPFSIIIFHGLDQQAVAQWGAWLMAAWTGLALVYLGLAAFLRKADKYAAWLNLWAMILTPLALLGLWSNWLATAEDWYAEPTLLALGGVILVYAVSAVIHDSGRHPALSNYTKLLPGEIQAAIFLWPLGLLLPVWLALAWWSSGNDWAWLGVLLAGLGLAYVGLGQVLARHKSAYRLPPHVYAYALGIVGVVGARNESWALLTSLLVGVGILASLALVYRRPQETALASLLFVWPFHIGLQLSPLPRETYPLAYALLATLGYISLGQVLEKVGRQHALAEYLIGYTISALTLVAVLVPRFGGSAPEIGWTGVAVPLVVAASQVWSVYRFRRPEFAWTAALICAIAYGQALAFLGVPPAYHAAAWVSLALVYLVAERALARAPDASSRTRSDPAEAWQRAFQLPLKVGAAALCALGLSLTVDHTTRALLGETLPAERYLPLLLAQGLAVGLTILAARVYRSHWPLYLEPWLAFFPVTLCFVAYGEHLNDLGTAGYALVWAALALAHLCTAAIVDRARVRYAHGLYLGGYGLGLLAVSWALQEEVALFWTLGLALAAAIGSAWLVHAGRHRTWDELITSLFGQGPSTEKIVARGAFLWFADWTLPIWSVLLLRHLGVIDLYQWLGLAVSALLLLALARWLRRAERSYAWPLHSAAQCYAAAGLIIGAPVTARLIGGYLGGRVNLPSDTPDATAVILQGALGVAFYAGSAWVLRARLFAYVAAWLSIVPYTLAWMIRGPALDPAEFAWVWMGWAALLLLLGFLLDRGRARYAHGPYLAGYLLGVFALLWSAQSLLTGVSTLGVAILLAAVSQLLVHLGRHRSFSDLVRYVWRVPGTAAERTARNVFLFFAVYGFPVWLTGLLLYHEVPLSWRGVALAIVAPIYIACGLALRRVRTTYAWPFYSAGYALTAIGAMLTFEDQKLAICTLTLNAGVYAVSAYIFRQPFWLYLSNALVPIITLLALDYRQMLITPWVAGAFMALSFLYFAVGQWFDLRPKRASRQVAPFALPFYAPAYLISAIALAVASASGEKSLILAVYVAGVGLYAISAWALREPLFLYPAVWLTTVPYYVLMTLSPLPSRWYGLGWLPLIVACIVAGRYTFVERHSRIRDLGTFVRALERPATPFCLLAYALTLLMVAVSGRDQLALACAFAAAAAVYLASAALFQHPAWLYPGLAAVHLSLATGAGLVLSAASAHVMAVPFLWLTWALALAGLVLSQRDRARDSGAAARQTTGDWAFVRRLATLGWAAPLFQFAAFDLLVWQLVALQGTDTTVVLGLGNAALVALFATLWLDAPLAYAALGYLALTLASVLHWAELPVPVAMAWAGAAGFGLYLLAWLIERLAPKIRLRAGALGVWPRPLTFTAIGLTTLGVAATAPTIDAYTSATAAALAAAGALALTIAYRIRWPRLGYAGAALLLSAWVLVLTANEVNQPQLYAIPAGLYLVSIGVLERQQAPRPFARYIESFGLTVMLLTSFIQSMGAAGFPYFVLLLVQALLVILWGAVRRIKISFFMGIGASVLNVVAQLTVLLLAAQRRATEQGDPLLMAVLIILGVGLVLCFLAVLVERQRARLIAQAREWRVALETWD
jgi:hypothetical protein